VGIDIEGDGGAFERWCSKMATGSGKTIIMSMIIAWNFLNKVTNPTDARFSKYALCVAPGLTVKSRLQVLQPTHTENTITKSLILFPAALMDKTPAGKSDYSQLAFIGLGYTR
jgi:type III restriction enzyme